MIDMDFSRMLLSCKMQKAFEWEKWRKEIPYINFPANFLVQIIPPLTGAMIRFRVADKNNPEKQVSIYLDCYDCLGCFGEPYWELYPGITGDTERYAMNDVDGLLNAIQDALTDENRVI